jgi:hypothetical protein
LKSARVEERAHSQEIWILLLTALLLGFVGCTTVAPSPKISPDTTPPLTRDPRELAKSLAERLEQFRSLRTLASVSYSGPEGKKSFQEAVVVRRPDHLRLETLSPLGAILIVTVNGREIIGFHPREALFFRGESSRENLLRYTQVSLELEELTSLLVGLPPVESGGTWEGDQNSISKAGRGGRKDTVVFDPASVVPIKWERSAPDGKTEVSATFSDYSSTPAGLFPLRIVFEAPMQRRRLEIRYQEPELNVSLPFDLFVQKKPAHATELPIESLGG